MLRIRRGTQVDDVRAGSVKLGLTFKSGGSGKSPTEVMLYMQQN